MDNSNLLWDSYEDLLPEVVITLGGAKFYPKTDVWKYNDRLKTVHIDFTKLSNVGTDVLLGLKIGLIWYAENQSPSSVENMFSITRRICELFCKGETIQEISEAHLMSAYSKLSKSNQYLLGQPRHFLINGIS